ncbi:MAG: hypothetical protein C0404_11165 [Verrucomicrobia bacterium]|nr:hypothetical protein [Verrucomicrobiota bacterium]
MTKWIAGLVIGAMVAGCTIAGEDAAKKDGEKAGAKDPKAAEAKPAVGGTKAGDIIFGSNRSGQFRIWSINADGSDLKQVSQGAKDDEMDVDPNYSMDGTKITFTSTRGGKPNVWRMNADGSGAEMICEGRESEWSPDARKVTFIRNDKVWVRDLESGKEKQVVPDSFKICSGPAFSPDGKLVTFGCRWEGANAVYTVPADGGAEPTKVYDKKPACQPHFSPDGKLIAYETETNICTIQPDGQKNKLVTYWGGVQRFANWSPDGKTLVYCQGASEKGPWELYLVPSISGNPTKLTSDGSDVNPCWSPVKK